MMDTLESVSDSGHQSLPSESVPAVALAEVPVVINYIKRVIPALLEEDSVIHPSLEVLLRSDVTTEKIRRFISDGQMRSLLIQRSSSKGIHRCYLFVSNLIASEDEEESGGDTEDNVVYSISEEVRFSNAKINSVVMIKRGLVLEAEKNISQQLRVMNLNDASPYETLHSYVSAAVAPYFKSYVKETGRAERFL